MDYDKVIKEYKKMNYDKIISDNKKYHFILLSGNKAAIIGSGQKTNDAKKMAEEFILSKKKKFEDFFAVRLMLGKLPLKLIKLDKSQKESGLVPPTIGGPIKILIEFYQIKNNKLKKIKDSLANNKLFITDKYLSKNNKIIKPKDLKIIAVKTKNMKLSKTMYVLNKIDKFIK